MPVHCEMKQGRWRVCDKDGRIERNATGGAVDGGGHDSEQQCKRQMVAMNAKMQGGGKGHRGGRSPEA